jgi:hypothetical protein
MVLRLPPPSASSKATAVTSLPSACNWFAAVKSSSASTAGLRAIAIPLTKLKNHSIFFYFYRFIIIFIITIITNLLPVYGVHHH